MAYEKTNWLDHSVTTPNKFRLTDNGDGTVLLEPVEGMVLQEGTPVNAVNLNKIESELEALENKEYSLDGSKLVGVLPVTKGGTGSANTSDALNNLGAAAASHGHSLNDLSGTLNVNKGGTGAITPAAARTALGITPANIGAASSSHTHSLTDSAITGVLPINKGGTGASSAPAARAALGITLANLGAASASHTHGLNDSGITGTLSIGKGGTGATNATAARAALGITLANLGAASSSHTHALNSSSLTSTLPVSKGGTGWSQLPAGKMFVGGDNTSMRQRDYAGYDWNGAGLGTFPNGTNTTITLPQAGTWLIMTGHNSTASGNTVWLVRTGGNNVWPLAQAGSQSGGASDMTVLGLVSMKVSGTALTGRGLGLAVNVYGIYLG